VIRNKKSKSRWATIFKNFPMVNMTEKEIRLLDDDDDDELPKKRTTKKIK